MYRPTAVGTAAKTTRNETPRRTRVRSVRIHKNEAVEKKKKIKKLKSHKSPRVKRIKGKYCYGIKRYLLPKRFPDETAAEALLL